MSIEFVIKDSTGKVVLDLASRITYFDKTDTTVYLPSGVRAPAKIVDLGKASLLPFIWFYLDTPDLFVAGKRVISPLVTVKIGTKATFNASSLPEFKQAANSMSSDRCYLVILDSRGSYNVAYSSNITISIGRY